MFALTRTVDEIVAKIGVGVPGSLEVPSEIIQRIQGLVVFEKADFAS